MRGESTLERIVAAVALLAALALVAVWAPPAEALYRSSVFVEAYCPQSLPATTTTDPAVRPLAERGPFVPSFSQQNALVGHDLAADAPPAPNPDAVGAPKRGTIVPYNAEFAARQMGPVEIQFPARGLSAGDRGAFVAHLAEQEAELNRMSILARGDLETNLANFRNVTRLNARARRLARGYLPGNGAGLDAAHRLDAVAGGFLNNFAGFRNPVAQELIGSLWRERAGLIVPGRVHRLISRFLD